MVKFEESAFYYILLTVKKGKEKRERERERERQRKMQWNFRSSTASLS